METRYYRPGQIIFSEGQASQSLYLVNKGIVVIQKMKTSTSVELARVYANEVIGELSFFDRNCRSATAVAFNEVELTEIDFESLDRVFESTPSYLKTIIAAMAERLRKANEVIRKLQKYVPGQSDPAEGDIAGQEFMDTAAVLAATSGSNTPPDSA